MKIYAGWELNLIKNLLDIKYSFLKPIKNKDLFRLGNNMDGGYIVSKDSIEKIDTLVSFGLGDTPIKEVLQLMRNNKYTFPATIEYEYKTPDGSSIISEIKKSIAYCKDALES